MGLNYQVHVFKSTFDNCDTKSCTTSHRVSIDYWHYLTIFLNSCLMLIPQCYHCKVAQLTQSSSILTKPTE